MDNFELSVTTRGRDALGQCFDLAFFREQARSWYLDPSLGFVLLWKEDSKGTHPLPTSLSADGAADLAWNWLAQTEYPERPSLDGSSVKGFNVYANKSILGEGSILAVKPVWALIHK